jgi:hypothetical protein
MSVQAQSKSDVRWNSLSISDNIDFLTSRVQRQCWEVIIASSKATVMIHLSLNSPQSRVAVNSSTNKNVASRGSLSLSMNINSLIIVWDGCSYDADNTVPYQWIHWLSNAAASFAV